MTLVHSAAMTQESFSGFVSGRVSTCVAFFDLCSKYSLSLNVIFVFNKIYFGKEKIEAGVYRMFVLMMM